MTRYSSYIQAMFFLAVMLLPTASLVAAPFSTAVGGVASQDSSYYITIYIDTYYLTKYGGDDVMTPAQIESDSVTATQSICSDGKSSYFDNHYRYSIGAYGPGPLSVYRYFVNIAKVQSYIGNGIFTLGISPLFFNGRIVGAKIIVGSYISLITNDLVTRTEISTIDTKHQPPDNTPLRVVFLIAPFSATTDNVDNVAKYVRNHIEEVREHGYIIPSWLYDVDPSNVYGDINHESTVYGFLEAGVSTVVAIDPLYRVDPDDPTSILYPDSPSILYYTYVLEALYETLIIKLGEYTGFPGNPYSYVLPDTRIPINIGYAVALSVAGYSESGYVVPLWNYYTVNNSYYKMYKVVVYGHPEYPLIQ